MAPAEDALVAKQLQPNLGAFGVHHWECSHLRIRSTSAAASSSPAWLCGMLCRHYFGDQVGFYLAYLNALTCWLLAPAAASSFLLWALGASAVNRTGERGGGQLFVEAGGPLVR